MKLWVARNEGYEEEEVLHDRFKHVSGELFIFYDTPLLVYDSEKQRKIWTCSREMCEVPSYMFPGIKEGECVVFSNITEKEG